MTNIESAKKSPDKNCGKEVTKADTSLVDGQAQVERETLAEKIGSAEVVETVEEKQDKENPLPKKWSKIMGWVIPCFFLLLFFARLADANDLERPASKIIEEIFEDRGIKVKCRGIKNLSEIRDNYYQGTALIEFIGGVEGHITGIFIEMSFEEMGVNKGTIMTETVQIEDFGDIIEVTLPDVKI